MFPFPSPHKGKLKILKMKKSRYFGKLNRNELNCTRFYEILYGKRGKDRSVNIC